MASIAKFGAALGVDTFTKSVEVEKTIEKQIWKNKSGVDAKVHTFNPTTKFTVEILGDARADYDVGVTTALPLTGITGGVTVHDNIKYSEAQDDKGVTIITGENHPSASGLE